METRSWDLPGARVWLARTGDVAAEEWSELYGRLAEERRRRCDRCRREADRRRGRRADALARHALAQAAGTRAEALTFARTETGKPYAVGLDRHFSLSHSGCLVLCAVADHPVGADIQRHRSVSPSMTRRLARAGYAGASEEDFFEWWTRQEAAGKLAGTGLKLAPLPEGLVFWNGRLTGPDGLYSYCVCAKRDFSSV